MKTILLYIETSANEISKAILPVISAGLNAKNQFKAEKLVGVLLGGPGVAAAADGIKNFGLDEVVTLESPVLAEYNAIDFSQALLQVCKEVSPSYVMAAASSKGKDFIPRVSAQLDIPQASDVIGFLENAGYRRPIFAGNIIAEVELEGDVHAVTVRTSAFDQPQKVDADSPSRMISATIEKTDLMEVVSFNTVKSERPELGAASVVVSGGRVVFYKGKDVVVGGYRNAEEVWEEITKTEFFKDIVTHRLARTPSSLGVKEKVIFKKMTPQVTKKQYDAIAKENEKQHIIFLGQVKRLYIEFGIPLPKGIERWSTEGLREQIMVMDGADPKLWRNAKQLAEATLYAVYYDFHPVDKSCIYMLMEKDFKKYLAEINSYDMGTMTEVKRLQDLETDLAWLFEKQKAYKKTSQYKGGQSASRRGIVPKSMAKGILPVALLLASLVPSGFAADKFKIVEEKGQVVSQEFIKSIKESDDIAKMKIYEDLSPNVITAIQRVQSQPKQKKYKYRVLKKAPSGWDDAN